MVSGAPDWQTWAGRSAAGGTMISYSFSGSIASGDMGYFDLPVVAEGHENIYQNITISCNDDTAIHALNLMQVSDSWVFFRLNFITGGIYDFPGQAISAGETVRVIVTNNSDKTLTFEGAINYVIREI